jgi:hypothetical protein
MSRHHVIYKTLKISLFFRVAFEHLDFCVRHQGRVVTAGEELHVGSFHEAYYRNDTQSQFSNILRLKVRIFLQLLLI